MKHRIAALSAILLALTATAAVAQAPAGGPPPGAGQGPPGQGPGGGASRRMQALLNGITLTSAQQARFDSIQTKYQAQMPPFTPGTPPDSATMARRRELGQKRDGELRAALTAEQQAIWDRNLANLPAPRRP